MMRVPINDDQTEEVFLGLPLRRRGARLAILSFPDHSLRYGLSAPPTASQASAPGVVSQTRTVF
jgi:hypothetical protein